MKAAREYFDDKILIIKQLGIAEVCAQIRGSILSYVRNERYAYRGWFSEEKLIEYIRAKKSISSALQQRQEPEISEQQIIYDTPTSVVIIYDVLETVASVSQTIGHLEEFLVIDAVGSKQSIGGLIWLLLNDVDMIYERLSNLNHMPDSMHLVISPLLDKLQLLKQRTLQYKARTTQLTGQVIQKNQFMAKLTMPKNLSAFLNRVIALCPDMLRELTELVEKGDLKIDFDPLSQKITTLEEDLFGWEHHIETGKLYFLENLRGLGNLALLIYPEIEKILRAAKDLSASSRTQAMSAYTKLKDEILVQLHAELEQLEENIGLELNVLTAPFVLRAQQLLGALHPKLEDLNALSVDLSERVNQFEHPVSNSLGIPMPLITAIEATVEWCLGFLLGRSQAATTRTSNLAIVATADSARYLPNLRAYRLSRYAALDESSSLSREQSARNFFAILKRCHAQAGKLSIQSLPQSMKTELTDAYQAIQVDFAQKFPKLDVDIVTALMHSQQDAFVRQQAVSWIGTPDLAALAPYVFLAWMIAWPDGFAPYVLNFFALVAVCVVITTYTADRCDQFQHVLDCEHDLITQFKQQVAENKFKQKLILRRVELERECDSDQAREFLCRVELERECDSDQAGEFLCRDLLPETSSLQIPEHTHDHSGAEHPQRQPLRPLGANLEYQTTLWGKLKILKFSQKITAFEQNHLYPKISKLFTPADIESVFYTNNSSLKSRTSLPFSRFHDKERHVQLYKNLLNALFYLKKCLVELEKVDDLGEPAAWNFLGRGAVVFSILWPILNDGIQGYYYITQVMNEPLLRDIVRTGLSAIISELASVLPFLPKPIYDIAATGLSAALPFLPECTVGDAAVPLVDIHQQQAATDGYVVNQSAHAISSLLLKLKSAHAALMRPLGVDQTDALAQPQSITEMAEDTIKQFFETLRVEVLTLVFEQKSRTDEPKRALDLASVFMGYMQDYVMRPEAFISFTQEFARKQQDIPFYQRDYSVSADALWLFDHIILILQKALTKIAVNTSEEFMQNIQFFYDLVTYKLLTQADDLELKLGLQPGTISSKLQENLDVYFDTKRKQYSKDGKYRIQALSNQNVFVLRNQRIKQKEQELIAKAAAHKEQELIAKAAAHKEKKLITKAAAHNTWIPPKAGMAFKDLYSLRKELENVYKHRYAEKVSQTLNQEARADVQPLPTSALMDKHKLRKELESVLRNGVAAIYTDSGCLDDLGEVPLTQFDCFFACYRQLQPLLCQYDSTFDNRSFLEKLDRNRPSQFIAAINQILNIKKDIKQWWTAQSQHAERQAQRCRELADCIKQTQQKNRKDMLIRVILEEVLQNKFADSLGSSVSLLQELMVATEQAELLRYMMLNQDALAMSISDLDINYVSPILDNPERPWRLIISLLEQIRDIEGPLNQFFCAIASCDIEDKKREYRFEIMPQSKGHGFLTMFRKKAVYHDHQVIYLQYDTLNKCLKYRLITDPGNKLIETAIPSKVLDVSDICERSNLTAKTLETLIRAKSVTLLEIIEKNKHISGVKNPCLLQARTWIKSIGVNELKDLLMEMLEKDDHNTWACRIDSIRTIHTEMLESYHTRLSIYEKLIKMFDLLNDLKTYYINKQRNVASCMTLDLECHAEVCEEESKTDFSMKSRGQEAGGGIGANCVHHESARGKKPSSDLVDILNFIEDLQQILGEQDSSVVNPSLKFHTAIMGKCNLVGKISMECPNDIMKKITALNASLLEQYHSIGIRDRCNMI